MSVCPHLFVEGRDDQWSVIALMNVNGIVLKKDTGPVVVQPTDSVNAMLDGLITFIKTHQSKQLPVGFVLDIDENIETRWNEIRSKLVNAGYEIPDDALSPDGVIIQCRNGPVGFWLMPDNQCRSGKLEDFLRTLISSKDASIGLAQAYVNEVRRDVKKDARFRDIDIEKAEISAWLAVQDPPGLPYGTAITAKILSPTSSVAKKFVSWFCRLYNLQLPE